MLMPSSSQLKISLVVMTAGLVVGSLLPGGASLHDPRVAPYVDGDWVHFIVYLMVAALPMLVWKVRRGIGISIGLAAVSVLLQVVHGQISAQTTDAHSIVVNLLGIAAGILLGLNLRAIRSRANQESITSPDL